MYDFLAQLTGLGRTPAKKRFLVDVLAQRGRYPSLVGDAFCRAFPEVYSFIRRVNYKDHGELIRRLQRLESWLVVEQVAPKLVGRVPVLTLHDAIFSTGRGLPVVEQAFGDVFDDIGFRLTLKREGHN